MAHSSSPAAVTRARGLGRGQTGDLAHEGPDGPAELGRAPELVALPERQTPRQARGRGHEHPVVGDVLDPPGRGAEGEHVADAGLVDHLLVQLADPPAGAFPGGEEHGVQPAVGDGATTGDGQPLRAAATGEDTGDAVPDDPWTQLGELVARVAAGQHVEHRLEDRAGSEANGVARRTSCSRSSTDQSSMAHIATTCWASTSTGLAGTRSDSMAPAHPLHDDRGLDQVAAELREQHATRHGPDLVAGTPHPLQATGDAGRRLDLHDEVDGTHVDAELETGSWPAAAGSRPP